MSATLWLANDAEINLYRWGLPPDTCMRLHVDDGHEDTVVTVTRADLQALLDAYPEDAP